MPSSLHACILGQARNTAAGLTRCLLQVRRHAAEQLYISFLGREDAGDGQEAAPDYEQAADLLLSVAWDGPLEEVVQSKQELAELLQLA